MSTLFQDLRFAVRLLARSPGFTAVVIAILALGIGFNSASFSLLDAIVLHPLPGIAEPERLVHFSPGSLSYPSFTDFRANSRSFSGLAAQRYRPMSLAGGGEAERIWGAIVSENYFPVLGVLPARGRFFQPGEEEASRTGSVAVVSDRLWRNRFGSDPGVVGRAVRVNGELFTIVGVAPRNFRGAAFGVPPDLWIPIGAWQRIATGGLARLDIHQRGWGWLTVVGRLGKGIELKSAQAEINVLAKREDAAFPGVLDDSAIRLTPSLRLAGGFDSEADPVRFFALLAAAAGLALLIACANIANLLLARASARRREVGVRRALGASRGRLFRQLLTESLTLALLGGATGLVVAHWSLAALSRVALPGELSLAAFEPSLNGRVLLFTALLAMATGVIFGLAPAIQGTRVELVSEIKGESASGSRRSWLKGTLVAAQVALCLVLLLGAGLLGKSLRNALATDLDFEPRGVALASINLGLQRYDVPRALEFLRSARESVLSLPGVESASWAALVPLSGDQFTESLQLVGEPAPRSSVVEVNVAGPAYFRTLRIPLVRGREFDVTRDRPGATGALIVNETMAARFWPGRDPLGRRVRIADQDWTVVGVHQDSRLHAIRENPFPLATLPVDQVGPMGALDTITLMARTTGDPERVAPLIRSEIHRLDPSLPVFGEPTLEAKLGDVLIAQRAGAVLIGLFGILSLVLAAVGIYGVVSYSVAQRTREVGIRLALGAQRRDLRRMLVRQSAAPLAIGIGLGSVVAALGAQLLERFLYGVRPTDAATLASVVLLLAATGLLASWLPARRAAGTDPVRALRHD